MYWHHSSRGYLRMNCLCNRLTFDPDNQTVFVRKKTLSQKEDLYIIQSPEFFHRYFLSSEPNELATTSIYVNDMNRDGQIEVK